MPVLICRKPVTGVYCNKNENSRAGIQSRSPDYLSSSFHLHPFGSALTAYATEDFVRETGKTCAFCHQRPAGGALNGTGIGYIRNGYEYLIPERILEKGEMAAGGWRLDGRAF